MGWARCGQYSEREAGKVGCAESESDRYGEDCSEDARRRGGSRLPHRGGWWRGEGSWLVRDGVGARGGGDGGGGGGSGGGGGGGACGVLLATIAASHEGEGEVGEEEEGVSARERAG
jgi:hypothetical protein